MRKIDLHVHAGPSVMPRALDGAEMLREAIDDGYAAFVIKDHYFPTMMGAEMIETHLGQGKCRVFGGIALNNSVGGVNLKAVDAACALGAKFVWMPTVSALRHKEMHQGKGLAFPGSKGMSVAETPIRYLNEAGELDPSVVEVLTYLADKPEVILGTGHGSREEIDALIHKAAQLGVKRILVNHPHYMIGATLEDMAEWSRLGAFMELNATVFVPSSKFCTNDIAHTKEIIDAVGLDKIVVDSDYGQKNNGSPVEGLNRFIEMLADTCRLSEGDLEQICYHNPAWLLGLE